MTMPICSFFTNRSGQGMRPWGGRPPEKNKNSECHWKHIQPTPPPPVTTLPAHNCTPPPKWKGKNTGHVTVLTSPTGCESY